MQKKMKAWEQKFKKERKENIRYFKNIEAENNDLKGKLWDLRNRSRQGNVLMGRVWRWLVDWYKRKCEEVPL